MENERDAEETFNPDWSLSAGEALAVTISLSLHAHVPGWGGCTDEQLMAIAADVLEHVRNERKLIFK